MTNLSIHKDHRLRMREKYEKYGAEVFESHQLMEMLLFHSYRQGDTNPLAHRILNADPDGFYGAADAATLTRIEGVGENTANLLKISSDTCLSVLIDRLSRNPMSSEFTRMQFMWLWFRNKPDRTVALLLLDSKKRYIDCCGLSLKRSAKPEIYERLILTAMGKRNSKYAVLCHCHRDDRAHPSIEDIYLTEYLKEQLSRKGYTLLSHYIVTQTDCIECVKEKENEKNEMKEKKAEENEKTL